MSFGSGLCYCSALWEQFRMSEATSDTGLNSLFLTAELGCDCMPDNCFHRQNVNTPSSAAEETLNARKVLLDKTFL